MKYVMNIFMFKLHVVSQKNSQKVKLDTCIFTVLLFRKLWNTMQ